MMAMSSSAKHITPAAVGWSSDRACLNSLPNHRRYHWAWAVPAIAVPRSELAISQAISHLL
jgi:hypothetical protein